MGYYSKEGKFNKISDINGITVGHFTLDKDDVHTGITVILPGEDSAFDNKYPAACHVINGFGKSTGLIEVEEMGFIEAPIVLTNTFSVPECSAGILEYMLKSHPEIGETTSTINTIVFECNDSPISNIRKRIIKKEDVFLALKDCKKDFPEGDIGAGRGMTCYGLKGGIGSASRTIMIEEKEYTVGCLLLSNFGSLKDLRIYGKKVADENESTVDKGSCIIILATDLPLSVRQLKRCTHRAQNGLARTGTYTGNGSGDIVLMFSTANRIPHVQKEPFRSETVLKEDILDTVFSLVTDCVEESVISSLSHSRSVRGRNGKMFYSLSDRFPEFK